THCAQAARPQRVHRLPAAKVGWKAHRTSTARTTDADPPMVPSHPIGNTTGFRAARRASALPGPHLLHLHSAAEALRGELVADAAGAVGIAGAQGVALAV